MRTSIPYELDEDNVRYSVYKDNCELDDPFSINLGFNGRHQLKNVITDNAIKGNFAIKFD